MLKITHNVRDVTMALKRLSNEQLPEVTVKALNKTAYDALGATKDEMKRVFDRPTRFTLNALMVWLANVNRPQAEIKERPMVTDKHYLKVQANGGERPKTGVEHLLQANISSAALHAAVTPADGAKLDRFGNWQGGQRNQMLSVIGAQRDARTNQTDVSKRRARGKRAAFFVPKPTSSLSPGVYARVGKDVKKVVNFTRSMPVYQKRIDFHEVIEKAAAEVFDDHFARILKDALG